MRLKKRELDMRVAIRGILAPLEGKLIDVQREVAIAPNLRVDYVVTFKAGNSTNKFLVEYKSIVELRHAKELVCQVKRYAAAGKYPVMVVAPFLSPEVRELLSGKGINFLDLSGNCRIMAEGLIIERAGNKNLYRKKKEQTDLLSPQSRKIIDMLIAKPQEEWNHESMHSATGVSQGLVHRVIGKLASKHIVEKGYRYFRLSNRGRLEELIKDGMEKKTKTKTK